MKKKLAALLCCLLVFTSVPMTALAESSGGSEAYVSGDYIEGEAIVCLDAPANSLFRRSAVPELLAGAEVLMEVNAEEADNAAAQTFGLRSAAPQPQVLALVKDESRTTAELIAELESYDQVVFAEPNYKVVEYNDDEALKESVSEALATQEPNADKSAASEPEIVQPTAGENGEKAQPTAEPADGENATEEKPAREITTAMADKTALKMTDYQWGFKNKRQFGGKEGFDMNYSQWNQKTGTAANTDPVVVAVVDTGVDDTNPDLKNKMWNNTVGLRGGKHGINLTGGDEEDTSDDAGGHGTHCAGIIGAEWNDFGVSGIAQNTEIMAIRRPDNAAGIMKCFDYMVEACKAGVNLRVSSNSWGISGLSQSLNRAVETLGEAGAISVFASGNSDVNVDGTSFMAASLAGNPYAVVVNATDYQGRRSGFSCYGQRLTDVMAPGSHILSTYHQNQLTADGKKVSAKQYFAEFDPARLFYENYEKDSDYWKFSDTSYVANSESYYDRKGCLKAEVAKDGSTVISEPIDISKLVKGKVSSETPLYFSARAAVLDDATVDAVVMAASVQTVNEDGTKQMTAFGEQAAGTFGGWAAFSGELPANTDYEHFTIEIKLLAGKANAHRGSMSLDHQPGTVMLDAFGVGTDAQPYTYMDGTSMACPAAAGAASVMAADYSDASAANLAARLIGSVKRNPDFADLCVSGGQVDLDARHNPNPVVTSAVEDGNKVTIEGYFFGNEPAVTLGETKTEIIKTENAEDDKTILTVEKPEGFAGGMTQVVVSNGTKTGQDRFELGARTDLTYYDQTNLPLPEDEAFYNMDNGQLVGYDGQLYYLPTGNIVSATTTDVIWRYNPEKQSWDTVQLPAPASSLAGTTWNGKLLINGTNMVTDDSYYAVYDGSTWQKLEYSKEASEALEQVMLPGMVNDGSRVLLFGGLTIGKNGTEDAKTVYELDVETGALKDTAITLQEGRIRPQIACQNGGYLVSGGYALGWNIGTVQTVERIDSDGSTHVIEQPSVVQEQQYGFAGAAVKDGYLLAGPINGAGTADTYTLGLDGTALEIYGKRAADSALIAPASAAYRGHFYVLAGSTTSASHRVFSATAVSTIDQPGDKTSGGGKIDPAGDGGAAKSGSVNTGIVTSPQYATITCLVLLALLLGGCVVYKKRLS